MADRTDTKVDLLGTEVELTGKVMPNGEVRRRVRMEDVSVHVTTTKVGGWQEAHFHKGLREVYAVTEGRMALAFESIEEESRAVILLCSGESVCTDIDGPHNVYLFPGTTIVTVVFGEAVGNPDRKGNDWWPADEEFSSWSRRLTPGEIEFLAAE